MCHESWACRLGGEITLQPSSPEELQEPGVHFAPLQVGRAQPAADEGYFGDDGLAAVREDVDADKICSQNRCCPFRQCCHRLQKRCRPGDGWPKGGAKPT
ncbi:unnamed protein product, partial [Polarella glacialis]